MDVSLRNLSLILPPLAGVLSYDVVGLLAGVLLSVAASRVPRSMFTRPLPSRPAAPCTLPRPFSLPKGAEPATEALRIYNRWLRECIQNCATCRYHEPSSLVPCSLLGMMRAAFPSGDPFTTTLEALVSEVRLMTEEVQCNNRLRERQEVRETPWLKYVSLIFQGVMWSTVLFTTQQLLAYMLAGL